MPRLNQTYICEICGTDWDTEEQAISCENAHYKPVEVTKFKYDKKYKAAYPDIITVKLENNHGDIETIRYYRQPGK